jgi:hypothetical protein
MVKLFYFIKALGFNYVESNKNDRSCLYVA